MVGTPNVGISGTWTTPAGDKIPEIQKDVVQRHKKSSPLMTWLSMTQGRLKPTMQTTWQWYEDQWDIGTNTVSAGITGGSATAAGVVVSNPAIVNGWSCYEPLTKQYFIAESCVNGSNDTTLTLRLLPSGSTITSVTGPVTLVSCGQTMIENGWMPDAIGRVPTSFSNSITKSAYSIEVTTEESLSPNYWGSKWAYDKDFAITQFRKDMERNLLFSKYFVETSFSQTNGNGTRSGTLRGTRGLINTIETNVQPYTGQLTKATLNAYARTGIWPDKYSGSATKMSLWGPDAILDITDDLEQKIRLLNMGRQMYGIDISFYMYGTRKLLIMEEPEFYDVSPYRKGIVTIDQANVWMRQYGPNLVELKDTSLQRLDGHSMAMIAMYGMETQYESSHSILKQPN